MNVQATLIRKEYMEDLLTVRGGLLYISAASLMSAFGFLLIGNTELSLLDNAQAVYMMTGLILALGAMCAVVRGCDGFAGERDRGTLESLMVAPVTGRSVAAGKLAAILCSWLVLFLLSVPYLWAVGSAGQNLPSALGYLLVSGCLLVILYGGITLSLSAHMRSLKGALSAGMSLFILTGIPMLLGPSLRQSGIGRFLDWLNPFAVAMNMMDSVVVDSQGLSYQILPLSVVGGYAIAAVSLMILTTKKIKL